MVGDPEGTVPFSGVAGEGTELPCAQLLFDKPAGDQSQAVIIVDGIFDRIRRVGLKGNMNLDIMT